MYLAMAIKTLNKKKIGSANPDCIICRRDSYLQSSFWNNIFVTYEVKTCGLNLPNISFSF